jgi:hypothetical protein
MSEQKIQSPFVYLQSAGSTGADGSTYGAHVRWLLLRNLGDRHFPKGDLAATNLEFNRPDDYVTLRRSRYEQRFPTIVDFTKPPTVVNDALAFWIYHVAETDTVVYIRFRDTAKYAAVRANRIPSSQTQEFVRDYCPSLIEAEVKDKLFFAAEFDIERTATTVMRTEALSVESNVPLSPVFVSCRKKFTDGNWCPPPSDAPSVNAVFGGGSTSAECCDGPNLLPNGNFEIPPAAGFLFQTDYILQGGAKAGAINVTGNARNINPQWRGLPQSGNTFLTVDGATTKNQAVLRFRVIDLEPFTDYCFAGWLATLWNEDVSIPLQVRIENNTGQQRFDLTTPAKIEMWEPFDITWNSGDANFAFVEIVSMSTDAVGNDFGLDNLCFCRKKSTVKCRARIVSENIRTVRFDVAAGYPKSLQFETYDEYSTGAKWETAGRFALTDSDNVAFQRLDTTPGQWQKFNDGALLNTANYKDRWTRPGGLKDGVQRYIALSNTDPLAVASLSGDVQPQDGSISVSMLDALRMVTLDFHAARMLGVGYLDRKIAHDEEEWIYLAVYDTDGPLDDTNQARSVRHQYMGVPTKPLDYRLPDVPQLSPAAYGLTIDSGAAEPALLTDANGYTPDGIARYVNLFVAPEPDIASVGPFYVPPDEFCAIDKTNAVFYGIEYRKQGEPDWRKPEIAHDAAYKDLDTPPQYETLPLPNNAGSAKPILRHEEREAGIHEYAAYGINWFMRISSAGNVVATDQTLFTKPATLLPPSNFAVQLIQSELPLMLTTEKEQDALASLTSADKTLVRVTFDYGAPHDVNYQFGDSVELFYRGEAPRNVVGALLSVTDASSDPHKAVLHTTSYVMNSQGTSVAPALDATLFPNFIGGVLSCNEENYIISDVQASTVAREGPLFTVEKLTRANPSSPGGGAYVTLQEWIAPVLDSAAQVMFMAVENMASAQAWGASNPLSKVVAIGDPSWTMQQETHVQDGQPVMVSLRGVWAAATVSPQPLAEAGVYRIDFASYVLPPHSQSGDPESVDWYKGAVRVPRANDPNGPRKILDVLLIQQDAGQPLVLHAIDSAYDPNDPVSTGQSVTVNYYPGYKLYFHADAPHGFTSTAILPAPKEGSRRTWLAARTRDTVAQLFSPVGMAAPVIAFEQHEPAMPKKPVGPDYATWPDFFYKCSYTFTIDFDQEPFSVVFYRSNDNAILHALYKDDTFDSVRQQLETLGDDDSHRADRWRELLGFQYANDKFSPFGGYAFPNPDKGGALDGSDPGTIVDGVRDAVRGAFTALTELPLIYDFIKGPAYVPTSKRQNIRNAQGTLLSPNDPEFDLAPMAKRTANGFEVQFTDFTLDGTGNNIFFYCGREIGNRGRMGEPGPIAGPVLLINTRPPDAPAVKRMFVQEDPPAVVFELNAYSEVQRVARILIYRTNDPANALSVRAMEIVKTIDAGAAAVAGKPAMVVFDDFENGFVPYGDPLFYRLIALRKVRKADGGTDWAPSHASKALLTTMIDIVNPEAPEITAASNGVSGSPAVMTGVSLSWPATVWNGTYYLDRMTSVGTWQNIYKLKTNQAVSVNLAATDLATNILPKESPDDGRPLFSRFRVGVENSSGLFNLADKVLTL